MYESQSSFEKKYVGATDELDSKSGHGPATENTNFNLEEVQDSDAGRDVGEKIDDDNGTDGAINVGNEGHVKSMIAKFSQE